MTVVTNDNLLEKMNLPNLNNPQIMSPQFDEPQKVTLGEDKPTEETECSGKFHYEREDSSLGTVLTIIAGLLFIAFIAVVSFYMGGLYTENNMLKQQQIVSPVR